MKPIQEFLRKKIQLPTLTQEHKTLLDRHFTQQEILESIKQIKGNMAPGHDGFIPEFYKTFKYQLAKHLTDLCNRVLQSDLKQNHPNS